MRCGVADVHRQLGNRGDPLTGECNLRDECLNETLFLWFRGFDQAAGSVRVFRHCLLAFAIAGRLRSGARLGGTIAVDATRGTVIVANITVSGDRTRVLDHVDQQTSLGYAYKDGIAHGVMTLVGRPAALQ